ncbi:hypothetical protein ABZX85_35175 [Streptomyces sp. NPDC004539]|uniref:hypothetical protein n=1 Tax=Streptomyces sp. NPDC004539 TaxID=3154280 RepID=UPI0033A20270
MPASKSPTAQRITDVLEPRTWIVLNTLVIGWHSSHWSGIAWGVFAAAFCAVIPMVFIKRGVQKGKYGDRHVGSRKQRFVVLPFILLSVAVGLGVMLAGGAPQEMIAMVVTMMVTLFALTAITFAWKISVHQAVASGSVVMIAVAYGPWALAGFALVALVGWSRIELRDHTPSQVAAGTVLGALLAVLTFAPLR